jgi:hypothetical protein
VAPPAAPPAPSWHDVAREIAIPAGDGFEALWVHYEPSDADAFLKSKSYGLTLQFSGFAEGAYAAVLAFVPNASSLQWHVALVGPAWTSPNGVGVTASSKPVDVLYVIVTSSTSGGNVKLAGTISLPPKLPDASIPGEWARQGPAEVSYFNVGATGPLNLTDPPMQHGVHVVAPVPPSAFAMAPFDLGTSHHGSDPGLEFSTSFVGAQAGAGLGSITWANGPNTTNGMAPLACGVLCATIVSHLAVDPTAGPTQAWLNVTGASAWPATTFFHASLPSPDPSRTVVRAVSLGGGLPPIAGTCATDPNVHCVSVG